MRISDWSSDVCSSDLDRLRAPTRCLVNGSLHGRGPFCASCGAQLFGTSPGPFAGCRRGAGVDRPRLVRILLERRIGFLPLRHPREATDRDAALDLLRKRIEPFLLLLVEFLPEFRSFTAYPADEPPEAANQVIDTPPKRSEDG